MSDALNIDADYLATGPTFASWVGQANVMAELRQQYGQGRTEGFDAFAARMFVARHGIWDILNDPDELVQRAIDERIQQLRMGVRAPQGPEMVGAISRHVDAADIEAEDLDRTDDVDEHLMVYESNDEREALEAVMAEHQAAEKIDADVGRYSGDTGGTRIITAEVYGVIERLHEIYSKDPERSKRDRSKRSIAREIQQDLLTRWRDLGLTEPVAVSDVTIDKIIRGVYRSQLRYGIPSELHFREWERTMEGRAGEFKQAAQDREARAAFTFTRRVLIGMALHMNRSIPEAPQGGLLGLLADAKDEQEFRSAAEKYMVPLFREHNVDFPQGWRFDEMRREVLYVATNMRYPQDVRQSEMRTMFRTFTPDQRYRYTQEEELPAAERQRMLPALPPV